MSKVLPKIISSNQFGFVKGRNLAENILLPQKIIRDINKRSKNMNVVVKLNMERHMTGYHRFS